MVRDYDTGGKYSEHSEVETGYYAAMAMRDHVVVQGNVSFQPLVPSVATLTGSASAAQQTSPAVQKVAPPPPRIVDHGTWIDIGGVRVEKRGICRHCSGASILARRNKKGVEAQRTEGVKAGWVDR